MRNTIVNLIHEAAKQDPNVYFLTGDLGYSVIEKFQKDLPRQCINMGISEQNMMGSAAGLALEGKKVFVYSIVPFVTMRCFEQIRTDVAIQNLDVNIIGVGGGFAYGTLGPTHYAIEDIGIMRTLPNMKIISPADPISARQLFKQVLGGTGPWYIRLNRGGEPEFLPNGLKLKIGKAAVVKPGKDVCLISTGNLLAQALQVADVLEKKKISCQVAYMHTIKPIDKNFITRLAHSGKNIFTLEEHNIIGGLGSAVAEVLAESGKSVLFKRFGVPDAYPQKFGSQEFVRGLAGLSVKKIAQNIIRLYGK